MNELRVKTLLDKVKKASNSLTKGFKRLDSEKIDDLNQSNINVRLSESLKKSASELHDTQLELEVIDQILKSNAIAENNRSFVENIIDDAVEDGSKYLEDSQNLLKAYTVYCKVFPKPWF